MFRECPASLTFEPINLGCSSSLLEQGYIWDEGWCCHMITQIHIYKVNPFLKCFSVTFFLHFRKWTSWSLAVKERNEITNKMYAWTTAGFAMILQIVLLIISFQYWFWGISFRVIEQIANDFERQVIFFPWES